jgi:hypothetical protein
VVLVLPCQSAVSSAYPALAGAMVRLLFLAGCIPHVPGGAIARHSVGGATSCHLCG